MSKAIRIKNHLYEEIERLAKSERRSLIAQLEVLLEQALRIEAVDRGPQAGDGPASRRRTPQPPIENPDLHFKPDFK